MEQWELNDYLEYFASSGRLFGVAESFIGINEKMQDKHAFEQKVVEHDRMYAWEKNLDAIKADAENYLAEHKNPITSDGKKRVDVMNALVEYCNREKRLTEPEANAKFFHGKPFDTLRKGASFEDITKKAIELDAVKERPFNVENVISYVNKASQLVQAAESYIHANRMERRLPREGMKPKDILINADSSNLKEVHYDYAMAIVNMYKPCLDSARDLSQVKELMKDISQNEEREATWNDLLSLRTKKYEISGKEEIKGDVASERILTTIDGEKGFVTRASEVVTLKEKMEQYYKEASPEDAKLMAASEKALLPFINEKEEIRTFTDKKEYIQLAAWKVWDTIADEKERQQFKTFIDGSLTKIVSFHDTYAKRIAEAPWLRDDAKRKEEILTDLISVSALDEKEKKVFREFVGPLVQAFDMEPYKKQRSPKERRTSTIEQLIFRNIFKQDPKTKEGKATIESNRQFLKNKTLISEFYSMHKATFGTYTVCSLGHIDEKDAREVTSRNVATSRLASLLGLDYLVTKSEKVIIEENGKQSVGCFMKFAEGKDARNAWDYETIKEFAQVKTDHFSVGFAKDACTLNLFDAICYQRDRHGGNLFPILSDPNEAGEREVIGIRAIDNDQAFAREINYADNGQNASLTEITFVDKALADKLASVTREQLEFALGDLLSPYEIDSVMTRITTVNKRIEKEEMIKVSGDEWKLDKYKNKEPDALDKQGQLYVKAVKGLEHDLKARYTHEMATSLIAAGSAEVRAAAKKINAIEKMHEDYRQNIQSLEEAVKDSKSKKLDLEVHKKTAESTRAERAALFDKMVASKMRREAVMKELDDSFTEITRTDIKDAKKNVKKPIIGEHRKNKSGKTM